MTYQWDGWYNCRGPSAESRRQRKVLNRPDLQRFRETAAAHHLEAGLVDIAQRLAIVQARPLGK